MTETLADPGSRHDRPFRRPCPRRRRVGEYRRRIEAGSFAIQRAWRLSNDDVQRRDVIVRLEGSRIILDESCWPLARSVASVFDSYLEPEEQRYAAAI
jgi:hypothetical protein